MFPGDRYNVKTKKIFNKYKHVRRGLLLVASIAFAVIVFWPSVRSYFERPLAVAALSGTSDYKFVKTEKGVKTVAKDIRFYGTDQSNRPYTLIANDGDENTNGVVFLTRPRLTLSLASGNTATLTATNGVYDKNKEFITLKGEVIVSHSGGYQFTTSLAWIDLTQAAAYGDQSVRGEGIAGTINAKGGFHLSDKGDKFIFLGRPELILKTKGKS